jgi:DNA adenine methylase
VGGKRQLLKAINELLPKDIIDYYEPFVGGGAFPLWHLSPFLAKGATINRIY